MDLGLCITPEEVVANATDEAIPCLNWATFASVFAGSNNRHGSLL